jgi:uncharacterized membrane protein
MRHAGDALDALGRKLHPHPTTEHMAAERGEDWQLRLADRITSFAGSMVFVWVHVALFSLWIVLLGYALTVDPFPFGFLTMIVSLEAIFLSTFVMIGQNRSAEFAARKAAHDYQVQNVELGHNTELTEQVHDLVVEIHKLVQPKPRTPRKT